MKFTEVAVTAFAAIVAAQTVAPQCAITCLTAALDRAGCPGLNDAGCACAPATQAVLAADSELALCMNSSCSADERATAAVAADDACREFGGVQNNPPACAVPCITTAFEKAGCSGLNDTECFCAPATQAVLAADSEFVLCMNSSCSADEVQAAIRAGDAACKEVGGTFSITSTSSTTATESTEATATESAEATATDGTNTSETSGAGNAQETAPPEVTTAAGATHSLFGGAALLAAVLAL